ncbi:N-acetylglucosamine-6-phosphate deacetylase [uncultured Selenomonas sp.]|uniref:N-acetylglucosamine-6-phosphate deacetylase n=1 Tax=uncultured Selenomonas sp. TaxID=159275 RepID=UPI0028E8570E|nr:N-acetylglucosamine-6-phosphate deacetylase [uncultured Selenomonas sp.]
MNAIQNGILILPDEHGRFVAQTELVLCYDERITHIVPAAEFTAEDVGEVINAAGAYVAPGFVNVHIHGCDGADTMDEDADALGKIAAFQARTGVTSFLPTTMTCAYDAVERALVRIRRAMTEKPHGARILGTHMEGPFISPAKKGAQDEQYILPPTFAKIAPYRDVIKIITVAPEMLSEENFIESCRKSGIIVSLGHTAADYETACAAIARGATHITHLCNAMTGLNHRKPGVLGAALDTDANCELIVDNVHVHPAMQRIIYAAKRGTHIIPITDSMRACGLSDGVSELGGQKVYVNGTRATLADGTIAGSVLRMNDGLRILRENLGASIPSIVEMATRTPAEELNVYDKLGSLTVGKYADIVIFDEDFRIRRTIVGGTSCFVET